MPRTPSTPPRCGGLHTAAAAGRARARSPTWPPRGRPAARPTARGAARPSRCHRVLLRLIRLPAPSPAALARCAISPRQGAPRATLGQHRASRRRQFNPAHPSTAPGSPKGLHPGHTPGPRRRGSLQRAHQRVRLIRSPPSPRAAGVHPGRRRAGPAGRQLLCSISCRGSKEINIDRARQLDRGPFCPSGGRRRARARRRVRRLGGSRSFLGAARGGVRRTRKARAVRFLRRGQEGRSGGGPPPRAMTRAAGPPAASGLAATPTMGSRRGAAPFVPSARVRAHGHARTSAPARPWALHILCRAGECEEWARRIVSAPRGLERICRAKTAVCRPTYQLSAGQ
jgi:hypothetical protein